VNQRKHLTLVAAAASLLAAMPLATVFETWTWLVDALLMVAILCATAIAVRSLRLPWWVPTAAMLGSMTIMLTWLFPSGEEIAGIIPSTGTFAGFNDLLVTAITDMNRFAAPVEDQPSLLFLSTVGVAGVTILVDLLAVVLRKPALTGLPMLAIYSVPVAVEDSSVSMVPFALGAAGFLWLLVTDNVDRVRRFGRRFTGDGRDVDLWEPSPLAAAGQRLALVGILFAVILPLAVPGMTTGVLDRFGAGGAPGASGNGRGGSSSSVSLFAVLDTELNRDRNIDMLKVQTSDPTPFYLRFGVADELSPAGFRARPLSTGTPVTEAIPLPDLGAGVTTRTYNATVEVLGLEIGYLPVFSHTTRVNNFTKGDINQWRYNAETAAVFANRTSTKGKQYRFEFADPVINTDALKLAQPLPKSSAIQQRFTVTPKPTPSKVRDAIAPVANIQSPYEKVLALLQFFSESNGFFYDKTTGFDVGGSKIEEFLTKKRGFCVQYAAALAWLAREAGMPARVAFGFTKGGPADNRGMVLLTNFNLHAWTEVYFQGFGWVPFDATPASGVPGSVSPEWAPNPSRTGNLDEPDDGDLPTAGSSVDPSGSAAPRGPDDNDPGIIGGGEQTPVGQDWRIAGPLGGAAILLALLIPALHRATLRRRRLRPSAAGRDAPGLAVSGSNEAVIVGDEDSSRLGARRDAHHAWDELIDTMIDYQVPVDDAETPRMTADRLANQQRFADRAATSVALLGHAEERARYARTPLTTSELRNALAQVRAALRRQSRRRVRITALLMPPSVTQRWRDATVRTFTDTVNAVARWRNATVRALSVRRMLTRTR
jgi:transglutaminase-like putative cysteine protease